MFDNLDSIAVMHTHGRCCSTNGADLNLSPPGQNGHHFADDTLKCIFINENFRVLINQTFTEVCF